MSDRTNNLPGVQQWYMGLNLVGKLGDLLDFAGDCYFEAVCDDLCTVIVL